LSLRALGRHVVTGTVVLTLAGVSASLLQSQTSPRRLTTVDAIKVFPGFFHLQSVVLRGEFVERNAQLVFSSEALDLPLLNPDQATKGAVEVRGQIIDVGRLEREDPRLRTYAERRGNREWPKPNQEVILNITGVTESQVSLMPTVRSVALEPWKYEGRPVTVTGNFRGRNLFGDLPEAPGKGRYDFVIGAAEGAVWIVGMRPRGRGFDFDVDRRIDSNRWLQVTGVVSRARGLILITATELVLAKEPEVTAPPPESSAAPLPPPPAEVVFSQPTSDETDVARNVAVRVQFSRGLRETTIPGKVRVSYADGNSTTPPIDFKLSYDAGLRAVQITFGRPLEPRRKVIVELLDGLRAFDGAPVNPWTLAFTVTGN
jgi:hypothetical protein